MSTIISIPSSGGGQNPHFDKPNGLDEMVKELWDVMMKEEDQIGTKLGVNAIREAYSPSPNDGYKLQMQALAQSRNCNGIYDQDDYEPTAPDMPGTRCASCKIILTLKSPKRMKI
jgi:hypothetical protein